MINQEDREFAIACLERLYETWNDSDCGLREEAKDDDWDPDEGGVPAAMIDGEADDEGYAKWRMLPSDVSYLEIEELEKITGSQLPPLFKAYLSVRFHLFGEIGNEETSFLIPTLPSDYRLGNVRQQMLSWPPLLEAGFVPFCDYEDGIGPVCFDTRRRGPDDDCPIVWMEHEMLHGLAPGEISDRANLEPTAKVLFPSFRSFMKELF